MKRAKHEYPTGKDLVRTMADKKDDFSQEVIL